MRGDADARGRGRGRKGKWKKSNARAVICRESPPGGRRKATRAAEICARPRPCRTPQPARSGRAWLGYHRNTEILLQSTPFLASIFADVRNARLPCFGAGEWPWRDIKAAPAYCGCKIFLTRPLLHLFLRIERQEEFLYVPYKNIVIFIKTQEKNAGSSFSLAEDSPTCPEEGSV
jgi:hypothetical protein